MVYDYIGRRTGCSLSLFHFLVTIICGNVTKGGLTWRFVGVYGRADSGNKHCTWDLIHQLCEENSHPILLGGDFNEILSHDEKEGGVQSERREIDNFREVLN